MFELEHTEKPGTNPTKVLGFQTPRSPGEAEERLAEFFSVDIDDVRNTFQHYFRGLPPDGHVVFSENLEGVQCPGRLPSRPFDIVGYDVSGKAVFRVIVSFPLMKGDFCSVFKTSNLRFYELSHGHRREVLEIRERLNRLFGSAA